MGTIGSLGNSGFLRRRLDPNVRSMLACKKTRYISVIVLTREGINQRIKKYIRKFGGNIREEYPFINAFCAMIPPAGIKPLESLYGISHIALNYPTAAHLKNLTAIMGTAAAHRQKLTGRNINIALLDTGTYPHPDLIRPTNRILHFKDFVNDCEFAYDDSGHGTFTAGIIAGNGCMSKGEYTGMAPESRLLSLKVLNQSGSGWVSTVLSGLQWVYNNREKYAVKLCCIPLGCISRLSFDIDPLSMAAAALWNSGVVVCTSVGNNGPENGWISSPGINPDIITVGALQNLGGSISQNQPLSRFSGRGFTVDGHPGPDFAAPGVNIVSLNSDQNFRPKSPFAHRNARLDSYYRQGSGTSVSCAAVTGIAALLMEKHPGLTPDEVKSLLRHGCRSLNLLKEQQGAGLPDINRLLD